jgi:hypothetical protein
MKRCVNVSAMSKLEKVQKGKQEKPMVVKRAQQPRSDWT